MALACLVWVAPAHALGPLTHSEHVARAIWGNVCAGDVTVSYGALSDSEEMGEADYWIQPDGTYTGCQVTISPRSMSNAMLCTVVVHEYGHLAGHEHSSDPDSIMYPIVSRRNMPYRCKN